MEKMTVIGRRKLNFIPKGQQDPVEGVQLFCTHPANNVVGLLGEKVFVNIRSGMYPAAMDLTIPCEIQADFNRWGKVETFSVVEPEHDKK